MPHPTANPSARKLSRFGPRALLCAASAALIGATSAWAQEKPPERPEVNWSAGVFTSVETSPYQGADAKRRLLPLLAFENAYVRWTGPVLDIKLPPAGPFTYALRARYEDAGYEASDAATLSGMAERKSSAWLGAKVDWRHPLGQLSAEWLADATDHSGGQQIRLVAEKPMRFGRVGLAPRVALVWQDSAYVDYYFGVKENEATASRAAYSAASALNAELGLRAFYGLTQQQSLFMDLNVTALGSTVKDSPLVDSSTVWGLRLGYAYRF